MVRFSRHEIAITTAAMCLPEGIHTMVAAVAAPVPFTKIHTPRIDTLARTHRMTMV